MCNFNFRIEIVELSFPSNWVKIFSNGHVNPSVLDSSSFNSGFKVTHSHCSFESQAKSWHVHSRRTPADIEKHMYTLHREWITESVGHTGSLTFQNYILHLELLSLPVAKDTHINTHQTLREFSDSTFLSCYCRASAKNNWILGPHLSHYLADILACFPRLWAATHPLIYKINKFCCQTKKITFTYKHVFLLARLGPQIYISFQPVYCRPSVLTSNHSHSDTSGKGLHRSPYLCRCRETFSNSVSSSHFQSAYWQLVSFLFSLPLFSPPSSSLWTLCPWLPVYHLLCPYEICRQ